MIWIVTTEGVYRHAIRGVYANEDDAMMRAEECARAETDKYHAFAVGTCELGDAIQDIEQVAEFMWRHPTKTDISGRLLLYLRLDGKNEWTEVAS